MNKTLREAVEIARALVEGLSSRHTDGGRDREVAIFPPFTALSVVAEVLKGTPVRLGAQDMSPEKSGAFTGEVSASMLLDAGCKLVILGHSERRKLYGDTDEVVAGKVKAALAAGLVPVACVGETLHERESQQTFKVVERQLAAILNGLAPTAATTLVIAYEPVWAIGTGKVAAPHQAQEVHLFLRKKAGELLGKEAAQSLRLLYGGSVTPDTVDGLMAEPDIDGALVGGASLKAPDFLRIAGFKVAHGTR